MSAMSRASSRVSDLDDAEKDQAEDARRIRSSQLPGAAIGNTRAAVAGMPGRSITGEQGNPEARNFGRSTTTRMSTSENAFWSYQRF